MEAIVVTVENMTGQTIDLELPVEVPVSLLAPLVVRASFWEANYPLDSDLEFSFQLKNEGIVARASDTLSSVGIVTGDVIQLKTTRSSAPVNAPPVRETSVIANADATVLASLIGENGVIYQIASTRPQPIVGREDPAKGVAVDFDLTGLDVNIHSSRRHAQIICNPDQFFVRDLRSANGTFVNGERLAAGERRQIFDGDQLQFGSKNAIQWLFHIG